MNLSNALLGGGTEAEQKRLKELREQESDECVFTPGGDGEGNACFDESAWPTEEEIGSLWVTFRGHPEWTGATPTIRDFGCWLAGSEYRTNLLQNEQWKYGVAEVTW